MPSASPEYGGTDLPRLRAGSVAFIYGTRETIWSGIARPLLAEGGVIGATLRRCEAFIAARLGWSFTQVFSGDGEVPECRMEAALAAVQLALTAAWRERGVLPAAVVGRCGGEFVAGHAAGAVSFEDAIELGCRVSRMIEEGRGAGRMVLVQCAVDDLTRLRVTSPVPFSIVSDGPNDFTVIACRAHNLPGVQALLAAQGLTFRDVASGVAPHTTAVEEWREEMMKPLIGDAPAPRTLPYYSAAAEGGLLAPPGVVHYWRVVREPALVGRALRAALADGFSVFVEIGGRPSLRAMILHEAATLGREAVVLPTMRQDAPVGAVMAETQAALLRLRAGR